MSAVVRKVKVTREVIERAFQNGEKPKIRVERGVPDDFRLFNVEMRGDGVLFWFCGPQEGEAHVVDDTIPVMVSIEGGKGG